MKILKSHKKAENKGEEVKFKSQMETKYYDEIRLNP